MGRNDQLQLAYLRLLSDGLRKQEFEAKIVHRGGRSHLQVTNPQMTKLTEEVLCQPADDGTWCFWWPWRQSLGTVEDIDAVVGKIMTVLRSVEEER
jgi:DNA/RNA-binding domain of Phe-tRNA-synthetase-like protein